MVDDVPTVDEGHIGPIDAFTLNLERDPLLRATIVALAVFDGAPDWPTLVDRVDRATRLVPRFRQKLVPVPMGLAPPRWVLDREFDLSLHVHRRSVLLGGDLDEVLDAARVAAMTAFDHDRPLWEFTLFEGLPDGRAALIMKLHHALTDGVGGIEIAAHVVDLEPEPGDPGPLPPAPVPRSHNGLEMLVDAAAHHSGRAARACSSLLGLAPHAVRSAVEDPRGFASEAVDTAVSVARFVRPVTATRSPIMVRRRPGRQMVMFDVDQAELLDAAHRADARLNDAFLAALAGGLRRYHEQHLAIVDRLRVSMPISTRTADDPPGGNRVTLQRFELPVGTTDPRRRMQAIGRATRALRADPAIRFGDAIAEVLNLLPVSVTGSMLTHVDLLASNVPGFDRTVYVGGAPLRSFHVFGATLGSAANVTLMSYAGTCHIGVDVDRGAIADPMAFRRCLAEGFAEVVAA